MSAISSIWVGRTAYQIIPDRFYRKGDSVNHINGRKLKEWNDRMPDWKPDMDGEYRNLYYYGGNLKGIEEKLPYLKDLGFNMVYITPIEQSLSYHHYDVGNQLAIDPWLGTWEDFASLCATAKKLDILIVVDLVFNHIGTESIYYKDPKYSSWLKKTQSGKQIFWWGFKDMAECNTCCKKYQDNMVMVAENYVAHGANGIRFDLGENLSKDFLFAMQRIKEKYPDTILIGEMWGIATDREDSKIFDGQLDSVMNYPMADAILRWTRFGFDGHFSYNFNRVYGEYPKAVQNVLLNNIGTHDTPTTITMLVGDKMNSDVFGKKIWDIEAPWLQGEKFNTYKFREYEAEHDRLTEEAYTYGKKLLKIALTVMYNIPGIPCVYQATEVADSGYKDPFNRKPFPWEDQDEEMKDFVRRLGKYREDNIDILATGDARIIRVSKEMLELERVSQAGKLRMFVNRTGDVQYINGYDNIQNANVVFKANNSTMSELTPYGILIVRGS